MSCFCQADSVARLRRLTPRDPTARRLKRRPGLPLGELRAAGRRSWRLESITEDAPPQLDAAVLVLLLVGLLHLSSVDMDALAEVAVGRLGSIRDQAPIGARSGYPTQRGRR